MVGVNMNHFNAHAHLQLQNKIENTLCSVHCGFTVLKANKNGWTSWIEYKNHSATNMHVNLAFRPLNFSQKSW